MEEFQKYHDEMKAMKNSGRHEEMAKRFFSTNAVLMGPLHEPVDPKGFLELVENGKMAEIARAEIVVKVEEIVKIGDVVIDRSMVEVKLANGDRKGWNLTIWADENGQWKIRNSCTTFLTPIAP